MKDSDKTKQQLRLYKEILEKNPTKFLVEQRITPTINPNEEGVEFPDRNL